ncbi:hypothetical protein M8C21_027273 [Ambrosia artemisiifolia]|uniref:Uncharacterized protein n=1 Tax=Ambrosia artemisiifolia TaxID=4212 RepID=A0AAD5GEC1_AMBAR|nr:hypothetical protein M8C21_027273 [Ambrosia artemisiifolia]
MAEFHEIKETSFAVTDGLKQFRIQYPPLSPFVSCFHGHYYQAFVFESAVTMLSQQQASKFIAINSIHLPESIHLMIYDNNMQSRTIYEWYLIFSTLMRQIPERLQALDEFESSLTALLHSGSHLPLGWGLAKRGTVGLGGE